MESQEQINVVLATAGVDLFFFDFYIKGIPGTELLSIQSFDSPYDIERLDISFQLSLYDVKTHNVKVNDSFTYTSAFYNYSFKIDALADDLTGWVEVKVKIVGKSSV
jgi:hypothetical protein